MGHPPNYDADLCSAALAAFDWLADEAGYEREVTRSDPTLIKLCYRSVRTASSITVTVPTSTYHRDPAYVSIRLAPRGDTACPLNQCLEAHQLDPVDLTMDFAPGRRLVLSKLTLGAEALRALAPWESEATGTSAPKPPAPVAKALPAPRPIIERLSNRSVKSCVRRLFCLSSNLPAQA